MPQRCVTSRATRREPTSTTSGDALEQAALQKLALAEEAIYSDDVLTKVRRRCLVDMIAR